MHERADLRGEDAVARATRHVPIWRAGGTELVEARADIESQPIAGVIMRLREQGAGQLTGRDKRVEGIADANRGEVILVMRTVPAPLRADRDLAVARIPRQR